MSIILNGSTGITTPADTVTTITSPAATALTIQSAGTTAMTIDTSQNVGIGTTTGGYRLHVNGGGADTVNISNATFSSGSYFIRFGVGSGTGTNVGYISYNGSGVTYSTTSDYRLKHSVTPMTTGLAAVAALKPVTYKWNADNSDGEGFIAHELQSVIPHAVTGDKDAIDEEGNIKPQGVDYSKIVVHLVAAIQELEARLAALEAK
jgi:hypothetical protein